MGCTQSEIHRSCDIVLHDGALLCAVWRLLYYCEMEERKGLEVPCKYNYYYGSKKDPAFIRNAAFILYNDASPSN